MADAKAIENRLITFFAWYLEKPPEWFSRATPVRKAFRNAAAWMNLADYFNSTTWMKGLRAKLRQKEMLGVNTIGELADLIANKAGSRLAGLPLSPSTDVVRPSWLDPSSTTAKKPSARSR